MPNIITYQEKGICSFCHRSTEILLYPVTETATVRLCSKCFGIHRTELPTSHTRKNHRATREQREEMHTQQNGVCAICGKEETAKGPTGLIAPLAVDHDHTTGKIRALLCRKCNTALGMLEENPERCEALANYIRKHK